MPQLPDPNKYKDPIKYFRDCHALITTQINLLEKLWQSAEANGVIKSIKEDKEWGELLDFLVNVAPRHEIDEENSLFPLVLEKLPHIGFQQDTTPMRFIHEQHEVMLIRSTALLRLWRQTLEKNEITDDEATQFLSGAKELTGILREHIRRENEVIYTTANDELLSPADRQQILESVRENHNKEVQTAFLAFDEPTYTLKGYSPVIVSGEREDAVSDTTIDSEDEEDSEEE